MSLSFRNGVYLTQIFQGGEKVWKIFQEKPEIQIFNRVRNTVSFISRLKSCMEKKVRFFVQRSLGYNGGFHLHPFSFIFFIFNLVYSFPYLFAGRLTFQMITQMSACFQFRGATANLS